MQQDISLAKNWEEHSAATLYVVTNQVNLRDSLAAGFIGPVNSFFRSYAADFLALCPGRIPLFSGRITQDMLDFVRQHHPATTIPVILEVRLAQSELQGVPVLQTEADGAGRSCLAYDRLVGLENLTAIHFLSEEELSEFRVRIFRDMPDYARLMRCTPSLLQDSGSTVQEIKVWLESLPSLPEPDPASFMAHDRVAGAYLLALPFTPSPARRDLLELVKRRSTADKLLLPSWLAKGIYPEDQPIISAGDENEILFAACTQVLHDTGTAVSSGQRILDRVEAELARHNLQDSPSLDILKKARRYLLNEERFRPLKSSRFVVAAALLLFLMRPDPERLAGWAQEETGATAEVMQTAMVFAGLLKGRKSLDTRLRPAENDRTVERWIVRSLNSEVTVPSGAVETDSRVEPARAASQSETETKAGNADRLPEADVVEQQPETTQGVLILPLLDVDTVPVKAGRPAAPSKRRKSVVREEADSSPRIEPEQLRSLLLTADYTEPAFRKVSLNLCLKLNWGNCVRSQIIIPVDEISTLVPAMRGRMKALALTIPGIAVVEYELLPDKFRECLLAVKPTDRKWLQTVSEMEPEYSGLLSVSGDTAPGSGEIIPNEKSVMGL